MQSPHWPEMCNIKEMSLVQKSENQIFLMETIQPNSTHASFSCSPVLMTDPTLSLMIVKKSTSQSHISKALHLPTSRIHSSNWICITLWLGVIITMNLFRELKNYFGSPDTVAEAESKLENLFTKPTQCIAKYIIEFN